MILIVPNEFLEFVGTERSKSMVPSILWTDGSAASAGVGCVPGICKLCHPKVLVGPCCRIFNQRHPSQTLDIFGFTVQILGILLVSLNSSTCHIQVLSTFSAHPSDSVLGLKGGLSCAIRAPPRQTLGFTGREHTTGMSAILSSDDLNDFISPGVACIKPVETLPKEINADPAVGYTLPLITAQTLISSQNPYEVTTEDKVQPANAPPASISLTDCLACSGCVTSAEAVLISLQSHTEVLNTLDSFPALDPRHLLDSDNGHSGQTRPTINGGKIFVASVSPQVRASIAATYGISERRAGHLIEQFLKGPQGLRAGGQHGSGFAYVVDTNRLREVGLVLGADELASTVPTSNPPSKPILTSACPGWICYAEKTHPHILPHLSRLKSPQALTGTLLKSILSKAFNIHPSQIWHLALMPCFDKKLEASREELTDRWWQTDNRKDDTQPPVRDVDCVITARELLILANGRNIALHELPLAPVKGSIPFPDERIQSYLSPEFSKTQRRETRSSDGGTSGGYMYHVLKSRQAQNSGSSISVQKGRNADVIDYILTSLDGQQIMKCARFYGFRNIQNLVRKLKPTKTSRLPGAARKANSTTASSSSNDYAYIEVMACPGGCTNGGGQIKLEDMKEIYMSALSRNGEQASVQLQRDWLKQVDEAYFSADSDSEAEMENSEDVEMEDVPYDSGDEIINGISTTIVGDFLQHWSEFTQIPLDKLAFTSYRAVESDVGKNKSSGDVEHVAGLASSIGGGW